MKRLIIILIGLILFLQSSESYTQTDESPIKIFGYFQNAFIHQTGFQNEFNRDPKQNSFSAQQLNLFFQKDLARNWRAFVNFEFLNNFASSRKWGSANLEEAWVSYGSSEKFNLKLGLLIPIFNNLNEIKNRTPLLPYIIRPLVYETSFNEFIATEEYSPGRAFVQAHGFLSKNNTKLDYAVFLGNSPNINDDSQTGQTGVDTTDTFLIGGRLGIRIKELKIGFSITHDNLNRALILPTGERLFRFEEIPRTRFGADLSYHDKKFSFEAEMITVTYDDDEPSVKIDREFYYATLGYHANEELFVYVSYWLTREHLTEYFEFLDLPRVASGMTNVKVPTIGISFNLNDRIIFKGQFAPVDIEAEIPSAQLIIESEFNHYSMAVSVRF